MLLLLHKTLKGSRNIQGFALIRVVLFTLEFEYFVSLDSLTLFQLSVGYVNDFQSQIIWQKERKL